MKARTTSVNYKCKTSVLWVSLINRWILHEMSPFFLHPLSFFQVPLIINAEYSSGMEGTEDGLSPRMEPLVPTLAPYLVTCIITLIVLCNHLGGWERTSAGRAFSDLKPGLPNRIIAVQRNYSIGNPTNNSQVEKLDVPQRVPSWMQLLLAYCFGNRKGLRKSNFWGYAGCSRR